MVRLLGAQLLRRRVAAAAVGSDQQLRAGCSDRARPREPVRRVRRPRARVRGARAPGCLPARRQRPHVTRCLVTDRRRLCPDADSFAAARRCLVEQARRAAGVGVDLIHIRERDLGGASLAALVSDLVAVTRGSTTRVVVNDRIDVALVSGADGVHLRGDSVSVAAARRLLPRPFLVGRSVHTVEEASAASDADYLIAGTVFPSASKSTGPGAAGLDGLRAIVSASAVPVLAIGGVTAGRLAAGVAARGGRPAGPRLLLCNP